jgi:transposase/predicted DNA-binding protein YlxM (UPF0122 family)
MTSRYCSPEESKEIIEMYRSGKYSFQQIADLKNLSKGTVINIVKGYPYNQDKQARYYKLQNESAEKIREAIVDEEYCAKQAYERRSFIAYGNHVERWLSLIRTLNNPDCIYDHLKEERTFLEKQSWEAFADGNYSLFGYCAETWETLTAAIGDNAKNPWKIVAMKINARSKSRNIKYASVKIGQINPVYMYTDKPTTCYLDVSDELWSKIKNVIPHADHIDGRKVLNGVLYVIANYIPFRKVPKKYGFFTTIHKYYQIWYRIEFLSIILEMAASFPELEGMRMQLWEIEKHRLIHGNGVVPRLSDIGRSVFNAEGEVNIIIKNKDK